MPSENDPRKKPVNRKKRGFFSPNVLVPVLLAVLFVLIVIVSCSLRSETTAPASTQPKETTAETAPVTTEPPPPTTTLPHAEYTASVGVTGDILVHGPIITNNTLPGGGYDFTGIYKDIKPYFEQYDCMIANLEVTLGGPAAGAYRGYPTFNCPDEMVDALIDSGVDLLLNANNHSYDTSHAGFLRTQEVLKEKNVPYLGTRPDTESSFVKVLDLNGVRVGMTCYTYETGGGSYYKKSLNGIPMTQGDDELIHTFNYGNLDAFYASVQADLAEMDELGADFTMVMIHWGNEYQFKPNGYQTQMAQKMCDLGVDVIVGGHPHVIQPYETLRSSDGERQTLCLYSTGNAVSNQRRELMDSEPTGHTEDGIIFGVTFEKWTDGSLHISNLDFLPTWVERKWVSGRLAYRIIPLDVSVPDWSVYGLENVALAQNSYKRTMELVGAGLNAYRASIGLDPVPLTV